MRCFLLLFACLAAAVAGTILQNRAAPFESSGPIASHGRIDDLAFARWKQLGIEPSKSCSDEVFLRRAYLDVIGTLPTRKKPPGSYEIRMPANAAL